MFRLRRMYCKLDSVFHEMRAYYAFSLRASTANTDIASAPSYVAFGVVSERLSRSDASLLTAPG